MPALSPNVSRAGAALATVAAWLVWSGLGCQLEMLGGGGGSGGSGGATLMPVAGSGGSSTTTTSSTTTFSSGAGGAPGCLAAGECPGTDTVCAQRICVEGVCAFALAPAGMLAGTQVAGDCSVVVCDGQGAIVAVTDDSDVPSDGNPCTQDVCSGGQPAHQPAPAGLTCGPGGQLACDGAGSCVGCLVDGDCGTNTACATYTCAPATGLCAVTHVPSGQGSPGQTAGDCRRLVCNGSGGVMSATDDGDVSDDGNPCTVDGCAQGQPVHAPASAGTTCGGSFQCDGAGACLACLADADCGAATPCAAPACDGGACVPGYLSSGAGHPGGQTAGDCLKLVCDGSGGVTPVPDDADVFDDGNPCTADACAGGVASHVPLAAGVVCGAGLICDGTGKCVGCITDAECGPDTACATHHCQAGACVADNTPSGTGDPGGQVAGDCKLAVCNGLGGATTVPDSKDVPDDGNPCTVDTCSGGAPQHTVTTGASCGAGLVCAASGACVAAGGCTPTGCQVSSMPNGNGGCTAVNKLTGTFCSVPGDPSLPVLPGVCSGGFCQFACFINGAIVPAANYPTSPESCRNCAPEVSRTSWAYESSPCHCGLDGGQCHGGACVISLGCVPDACNDCTLTPYGAGYCQNLPRPFGTPCPDDGNPCTSDVCNTGFCLHLSVTNGTSCGAGKVCSGGQCI